MGRRRQAGPLYGPGGRRTGGADGLSGDPDSWTSNISQFVWLSSDEIIFGKDGSLWTVSTESRKPVRLPGYQGVSSFSLSQDHKQIAYIHDGQVWVGNLSGKTQRQLTRIADGSILSAPAFSQDNNYVAFGAVFTTDTPEPAPYNGNRLIPMRLRSWNQRLGIVSVFSGDPVLIPSTGGAGVGGANAGAFQWATGSIGPVVVHQEFSPDHKHRELVETIPSGASHSIWQETDPLFVSPADGPRTVTSPDGKMIAFISDRTGWAHVYVTSVDATSEKDAKQIGNGEFGDCYINWSPDSKSVVYAHSEVGNQEERFLSIADVATGKVTPILRMAKPPDLGLEISPDGRFLLFVQLDYWGTDLRLVENFR